MSKDHWLDYHRAWARLSPPLRPNREIVDAVRQQLGPSPGRTLLLGVTPELADIAPDLVAIDRNMSMVMNVWPGNTNARRAVVGDWRNPNFASGTFFACVGDGSLFELQFPHEHARVFSELGRILRVGGKFVCRLYAPPSRAESVAELRDAALSGAIRNFHAFKFRLAMALAAQQAAPDIGVDALFNVFTGLFADRAELVRATGWCREHIDTIDFYRGSTAIYRFPNRNDVLALAARTFSNVRLLPVGSYEMADLCPLLVADVN